MYQNSRQEDHRELGWGGMYPFFKHRANLIEVDVVITGGDHYIFKLILQTVNALCARTKSK